MQDDQLHSTAAMIVRDFEIESATDQTYTEEQLFDLLADQIAYMIEYRLEFLLSLMYRLDISEKKVNAALSPYAEEPANVGLAKLVLERQKQRAFTKKFYKQEDLGEHEDLAF
ncbi:MAG: hypothetical protein AAF798_17195 [Bacteroidota bacterium]